MNICSKFYSNWNKRVKRSTMARYPLFLIIFLCFFYCFQVAIAAAETIILPVNFDYPLIRSIFLQHVFTGPDHSMELSNEDNSCQLLKLREPEIRYENEHIVVTAQLEALAGLSLPEHCLMPVAWEGYIEIRQKVRLDYPGWLLRFQTVDSRLFNNAGESRSLTDVFWMLVKKRLHDQLDNVVVSLSPQVEEVEELLTLFVVEEERSRITSWLRSLRPGQVEIGPDGIKIPLVMEVEALGQVAEGTMAEAPVTEEELDVFLRNWETVDAFMAFQVHRLGMYDLSAEERGELLDIIIEMRYQLIEELAAGVPVGGGDNVRRHFLHIWERVTPIFRRHMGSGTGESIAGRLSFLAYLTAGDALTALDKLSPALGIEISRNGLIRLARLLAVEGSPVDLIYSYDEDLELRRILGFGPALKSTGPVYHEQELELSPDESQQEQEEDSDWMDPGSWLNLLVSTAHASESVPADDLKSLRSWLVDRRNFSSYMEKTVAVMKDEARKIALDGLLHERSELFTSIMLATAWQESCFQQFIVKNGKLTFLRSWNNSSVGLMQVNERVWRGLYQIDALRWDPRYNIRAGGEILHTYMVRYGINGNKVRELGDDGLARAAYAMYNGGPGELKAFLARHKIQAYSSSDKQFWKKYTLTREGKINRVSQCLFGE